MPIPMSETNQLTFFLDNPVMYQANTSVFNQQIPTINESLPTHPTLSHRSAAQARSRYQISTPAISRGNAGSLFIKNYDDVLGLNQLSSFKDTRDQSSQALFNSQLSEMMDFNISSHTNPRSWEESADYLSQKSDSSYNSDDSPMEISTTFSDELYWLPGSETLRYLDTDRVTSSGPGPLTKPNGQEFCNPMELHLEADFLLSSQDYDMKFDRREYINDNSSHTYTCIPETHSFNTNSYSESSCSLEDFNSPVSPASSISSFSRDQSFLSDLTEDPSTQLSFLNKAHSQSFNANFNEELTMYQSDLTLFPAQIIASRFELTSKVRNHHEQAKPILALSQTDIAARVEVTPIEEPETTNTVNQLIRNRQITCQDDSDSRGYKIDSMAYSSAHQEIKEEINSPMFTLDDEEEFSEIGSEEEDLDVDVEIYTDEDTGHEGEEIMETNTKILDLEVEKKLCDKEREHAGLSHVVEVDIIQTSKLTEPGLVALVSDEEPIPYEKAKYPRIKSTLSTRSSLNATRRRSRRRISSASSDCSSSPESSTSPMKSPTSPNTRGRKPTLALDLSKSFVCEYCSRRFRRQEHLKRHFRSLHTREKPYECEDCGKTFSRSDNLTQHIRTHAKPV